MYIALATIGLAAWVWWIRRLVWIPRRFRDMLLTRTTFAASAAGFALLLVLVSAGMRQMQSLARVWFGLDFGDALVAFLAAKLLCLSVSAITYWTYVLRRGHEDIFPRCGRCRYILVLNDVNAGDSVRCPECGLVQQRHAIELRFEHELVLREAYRNWERFSESKDGRKLIGRTRRPARYVR